MAPTKLEDMLKEHLLHIHSGKVRETYAVPGHKNLWLQVATNRISTHNVVHNSLIPNKGAVLTALTVYWLRDVLSEMPHHLIAAGEEIYRYLPSSIREQHPTLHHHAVIVRKLEMIPYEFIVRRHMVEAGSLYTHYLKGEDPYELDLPPELPVMHRFDPPIFTPTEKSETDPPVPHHLVRRLFPDETKRFSSAFLIAEKHLRKRDIAILDAKGEMGVGGVLGDEIFTSDSSRFADIANIKEGVDPPWLDKELARQEAVRIWNGGKKRPLTFSDSVIANAGTTFEDILERITGKSLLSWINGEYNFAAR